MESIIISSITVTVVQSNIKQTAAAADLLQRKIVLATEGFITKFCELVLKDRNRLGDKIDANEIPAFEIKSLGKHGIFACTNSMHASRFRYEIIGTRKPAFLDEKHEDEF